MFVCFDFPPDTDNDNPHGHMHVAGKMAFRVEGIRCDRDSWTWYIHTAPKRSWGPFSGLREMQSFIRDWYGRVEDVL